MAERVELIRVDVLQPDARRILEEGRSTRIPLRIDGVLELPR